jgi:hypothetical protein
MFEIMAACMSPRCGSDPVVVDGQGLASQESASAALRESGLARHGLTRFAPTCPFVGVPERDGSSWPDPEPRPPPGMAAIGASPAVPSTKLGVAD